LPSIASLPVIGIFLSAMIVQFPINRVLYER
jgi:hypothetical protein